jgi:hypothetical protein
MLWQRILQRTSLIIPVSDLDRTCSRNFPLIMENVDSTFDRYRLGNGLRSIGHALAGLDELHGEHVLALNAPVRVVATGAMRAPILNPDDVGRPVAALGRHDVLPVHLIDAVEGRQGQAALLAIVHLPTSGRILFVTTNSIRRRLLFRQEAGYILLVIPGAWRLMWRKSNASRDRKASR